jgi:hypothetical protein
MEQGYRTETYQQMRQVLNSINWQVKPLISLETVSLILYISNEYSESKYSYQVTF